MFSLASLRDEYELLFSKLAIDPVRLEQRVKGNFIQALSDKQRYGAVAQAAGIPWYVVALIHRLESDSNFGTHLHNGDPLTARTRHVPAGRPVAAPAAGAGRAYTWEESAIDALAQQKQKMNDSGADSWSRGDWTVGAIAYLLEDYNGWGYRKHFPYVKSPYLWSFSNIYTKGKYRSDGRFDTNLVSGQCGGMVLLKYMMDTDPEIQASVSWQAPPVDPTPVEARPFPNVPVELPAAEYPTPVPVFQGRYIVVGLRGSQIAILQRRLADVGAVPKQNAVFDEVTRLAVELYQSRSSDLDGHPLEVDGVVGPKTWGSLFGPDSLGAPVIAPLPAEPASASFATTVLRVAESQVGIREVPLGSNTGPMVDLFLASVNLPPRNYWCMAFVYWCFSQAAAQLDVLNRVPKTGGVLDAWARSQHLPEIQTITAEKAALDPSLVGPGMVFFLSRRGGGHTGIVVSNVNGELETIEGNSSEGGSANGIGVFRRTGRRIGDRAVVGFARYG